MRWFVVIALLLALVGCQLGTTDKPAPTSTTSALDALRAKLERLSTATTSVNLLANDVPTSRPSPTITLSEGDGVCSQEERGSNSEDCDGDPVNAVPANWVPCGQTGAYCPPEPLPVNRWPVHLRTRWPSWTPSSYRPIGPYRVFGSDPNDRDGDGVACESGCRN